MPSEWGNALIAIVLAVIGLATLSVILSKQADTSKVISAASTGLGNLIKSAVSPVTQGFTGLSTTIQPLT